MVILDPRLLFIGLLLLLNIIEGAARSRFDWDDDAPFDCKEPSGYYADPKDCSAYYKCNFGNPIKEVCAPGLYFNDIVITCDWQSNVNCTQKDGHGLRYGEQIPNPLDSIIYDDTVTKPYKELKVQTSTEVPPTTPTTYPTTAFPTPIPGSSAEQCQLSKCMLPYCRCDSSEIPGNLTIEDVPQMVLLSFEDAINEANILIYKHIFKQTRTNPNNCPIKGTFFVSHEWTDYSQVEELYFNGHEIASRSISNQISSKSNKKDWQEEILGEKEILTKFANINSDDIRGMRAPSMQIGGNNQFEMLFEESFLYDSSISVSDPPIYPFTLDYAFSNCMIDPCPNNSYPGIWEMPLVIWFDVNNEPCVTADSCQYPNSSEGVHQVLKKNFERHYNKNRAPFSIVYRSAWFAAKHQKEGFEKFLTELQSMKNVWFVTMYQAIQWMKKPTPISQIHSFNPWNCNNNEQKIRPCAKPKNCQPWQNEGVRYFRTCAECPKTYPWVGNVNGDKKEVTVATSE